MNIQCFRKSALVGSIYFAVCTIIVALSACGGSAQNSASLAPISDQQSSSPITPESLALENSTLTGKTSIASDVVTIAGATSKSILSSDTFADLLQPGETIRSITICAGWYVDSIQFVTNQRTLPVHGANGAGNCHIVALQANENLTGIFGNAGSVVESMGFITDSGKRYGPFGAKQFSANALPSPGSTPFLTQISSTDMLQGFYGRSVTDLSLASAPLLGTIGVVNSYQGGATGNLFVDKLNPGEALTQLNLCVNANFVESVQMVSNARSFTQRGAGNGCTTKKPSI